MQRRLSERLCWARLYLSRIRRVRGPRFGESHCSRVSIAAPSSVQSPPIMTVCPYKILTNSCTGKVCLSSSRCRLLPSRSRDLAGSFSTQVELYILRPRLGHTLFGNIHDFSVFLHRCFFGERCTVMERGEELLLCVPGSELSKRGGAGPKRPRQRMGWNKKENYDMD